MTDQEADQAQTQRNLVAEKSSRIEDQSSDEEEGPKPWYVWLCRFVVAFIVIGGTITIIVRRDITKMVLEAFLKWLSANRWIGSFALFLIFFVAQTCMIPGTILIVGSGFGLMMAFKDFLSAFLVATGACWFGMWAGSITGMLFARYMFRKSAKSLGKKYKLVKAFDVAMGDEGIVFLIIMRICPLIPFAMQNYVIGATTMQMRHFWFTGVFMAPWTGMMVFFGTTISNIADAVAGNYDAGPFGLAAMIGGSVVAIIAFIFLSVIVKRHFDKLEWVYQNVQS